LNNAAIAPTSFSSISYSGGGVSYAGHSTAASGTTFRPSDVKSGSATTPNQYSVTGTAAAGNTKIQPLPSQPSYVGSLLLKAAGTQAVGGVANGGGINGIAINPQHMQLIPAPVQALQMKQHPNGQVFSIEPAQVCLYLNCMIY